MFCLRITSYGVSQVDADVLTYISDWIMVKWISYILAWIIEK